MAMAETEHPTRNVDSEPPAVTLAEPPRETETIKPAPAPMQVTRPARRGGFLGLVLGGALAAGAGYGVAQYLPDGWPMPDTAALEAALDAQSAEITDLKSRVAAAQDVETRLVALETAPATDLGPLTEAVAGLTARVAAIEALPKDGSAASPAAIAALGDAVTRLQTELETLKADGGPGNAPALAAEAEARVKAAEAQAEKMRAEAEALAKATLARAALGRLQTALDSGVAYAAVLPDLGPDLPEVLTAHAETGLPSLPALQASFPDAARVALEAALRADMGESWTERASSFLRNQTGARSLTPREGNDPDAILSRAEAALGTGNLAGVMTELSALPEVAQTAMADWRAQAEIRQAAQVAVEQLAARLAE